MKAANRSEAPIEKHHPFKYSVEPAVTRMPKVVVPNIPSQEAFDLEDAEEILEWISLLSLDSPRVRSNDSIDDFLCRYHLFNANGSSSIVKLQWRGFVPAQFVMRMFLAAHEATKQKGWMAISVCDFEKRSYTILGANSNEFICWECSD